MLLAMGFGCCCFQYNTCYWCLVKSGKSPSEAQDTLKVINRTYSSSDDCLHDGVLACKLHLLPRTTFVPHHIKSVSAPRSQ